MPDPQPQLYFNPRCSKARSARQILDDRGVDYEVVAYLDDAPSRAALAALIGKLDGHPGDLVRQDDTFKALGLVGREWKGDAPAADAVADLLAEHPKLIERPVFVVGDRAVIGRPPERVLELLGD